MSGVSVKIIFLFNFILLGLGIFIVYFGISDQVLPDKLSKLPGFVEEMSIATKILTIIGIVIFVMSFFGCWGAFTENTFFLKLYMLSLILLIVLEIFVGGYVYYKKDALTNKAEKIFKQVMTNYDNDKTDKLAVDTVQSEFECCGTAGPSDWAKINKTIPSSCCKSQPAKCETEAYKDGCLPKIWETISNTKTKTTWIIAGIITFELVVLWFTSQARESIREGHSMRI